MTYGPFVRLAVSHGVGSPILLDICPPLKYARQKWNGGGDHKPGPAAARKNVPCPMTEVASSAAGKIETANDENNTNTAHPFNQPKRHRIGACHRRSLVILGFQIRGVSSR